jgi:acyl dehydratase
MSEGSTATRAALYLEDLTPGQVFSGGAYRVTEEAILAFARDYDPQPFHTDPAAAQATFFGGLAASGWQTAAITMRLLTEYGPPIAGGLIGGAAELVWPQATRPGDVLGIVCTIGTVTPSRSRPERGMAVLHTETRNQKGEVVQTLTAKAVVPRRDG